MLIDSPINIKHNHNMKLILFAEVDEFAENLEKPTRAKWTRHLILLSQNGLLLGMPHARKINDSLFELRIRGKQEVRAFLCIY